MNKSVIAALGIGFTTGAIAGFLVGYFISIEKEEQIVPKEVFPKPQPVTKVEESKVDPAETERPKDDDPEELISRGPAHIAQPGQPGINYSKVNQIVKENGYTTPEEIQEVIEDPDNEESFEEREEREEIEMSQAMAEYRKKNKGKIVPIQKDEWDSDFSEVDYDKKDLYYFTTDDVLTDEDGNHLDETEYLGVKPRQFGWMANDEEKIYIRNHPKETDFQVWKEKCASIDWWT